MNPLNFSFINYDQFQYFDQKPIYEEITFTGIELPEPYTPKTNSDEEKKPKKEPVIEEGKPEKKKRGRKMQFFGKEQQKDRKRMNRKMSNRNDYGHQGYNIYLLLSCGCTINFEKVTDVNERVESRKLKIVTIKGPTGELLFNRSEVEKFVRTKLANEQIANMTRSFRNYMNIEVDNRIIDILVFKFNCSFVGKVKKEPDHEYMPKRMTIIQYTSIYGSINEKEIIEQGCEFYDQIKTLFGGQDDVSITLNDMLQLLNPTEYLQIIYSPSNTSPSLK